MTRVERERLRSLRVRSALHFRRFLARADANDILCPVRPSRDKAAEQTKRHHIMHCAIMAYVALFIAILAIFLPAGNADFLRDHKKKELPCVSCRHAVSEIELCAPPNTLPPSWECASLKSTATTSSSTLDSNLWDCLMAGSDGPSCRQNSNNTCVWCAEPVFGLCVTPATADKIGTLPMFDCDSNIEQ